MQKHDSLTLSKLSYLIVILLFGSTTPAQASGVIGEPCSIWYVDTDIDGWPLVEVIWVDDCPINCFGDIAGDIHTGATWCVGAIPPPNLPGIDAGAYCSASTSRTVTLMTAGTLGNRFEIEGPSGVVEATSFVFTDLPEGENRFRARAHNDGGSSEWTEWVSVYHDYSPPNTTAHFVGLVGMNDWYISPVSTTFNMSDNGCFGVSATNYTLNGVTNTYTGSPFNILNEGFNTLIFSSTDGHHPENQHTATIQIDTLAPTVSISPDRPFDVSSGWWTAPLTVTIHADDATSGISSLEYNLNGGGWTSGNSLTLSADGVYELDVQATDNAGHLSYDGVILPIDTSAPLLDVQITGEQGENSWFITPPTVTLSATDATSGVIGVLYQFENEAQTIYTAPLTFVREGLYTLQAFAVDEAQHITTRTVQIGYDITPPQTTITLTETDNGMTITLNRWDGVSGYALTRMAINGVWGDYHHPVTVTDIGEYWVQFYTIDFAGNIEVEKIAQFVIREDSIETVIIPPVVNIIPSANPPNTPPFETRDDFPPDLHDENVYFTYPEGNRIADTSYPPSQIIFVGGNANNGSSVVPMENRISRIPRPIGDESALPNVNSVPQPNVVYANSPNIIQTLQILDVPESQTAPATIQTASTPITANNPINGALATLATLGIIAAGAGAISMTATAIAKKREQDEAKSAQMATLQAQQSAQAQTASTNWATNQAMKASAKQSVVTQVTQSQTNKDFWSAYAEWRKKVILAEAEAQRKAKLKSIGLHLLKTLTGQQSMASVNIVRGFLLRQISSYGVNIIEDTDDLVQAIGFGGQYPLQEFELEHLCAIYYGIQAIGDKFAPIIGNITGQQITSAQAFQMVYGSIYMGYDPTRNGNAETIPSRLGGADTRNLDTPILIIFDDSSFNTGILGEGFVVVHELGHAIHRRHDNTENLESIAGLQYVRAINASWEWKEEIGSLIYETDFIDVPALYFINENGRNRVHPHEGFADSFANTILNRDHIYGSTRLAYIENNLPIWIANIIGEG